ncbi:DUF3822 family protein [Mucilaginibacter phyllosphaerae]|uniref:DUF3822 family protein n=1 Tax=Mucilaginibacter phyllosphaerae TaxID=1812349 RepID=A0A4Y8ABH4_9SPHI|nr:DUF3822 family protein [Mucilaginibacter phyllosphaerae]MBB3969373.1 hypothetical protein [Mucilaginibacter phyllosphaerae]TEW65840.1 DUF3822 family protein [Mucilaginibacter phyllosphaerae]GGH08031.1 hypothetical protein GCM10007352_13030 [Mucilaginibacter phyllosphaerae]
MSDHRHYYTSDDLSLTQAHSYTLLLQVNANSFNYAVVKGKQLLSWGENYSLDELRDPQLLRDILTANYNLVVTGLQATGFTLLPDPLFDAAHIGDIARLLDVTHTEKVKAEKFDSRNTIIYKVDEAATYAIKDLDNQNVLHTDAGWVKAIANNYPLSTDVYLNIINDTVSIVNFTNSALRFYNTFKFKSHEELAYFCALVCTELELKPEKVKLVLSGEINNTDRYFIYLINFFGEVKLNNISILDLPYRTEAHKILPLAALSLCASSEGN